MDKALTEAQRRQLALELRIAATAGEPTASDTRGRGLVLAQMNARNAFELADVIAGGGGVHGWGKHMGKAPTDAAREVGLEDAEATKGARRNKMAGVAARASSHGDM